MAVKKKIKQTQNISDAVFKDTVDDFDKFEEFFSGNINKILTVSVIVVLALVIGYIIYIRMEEEKTKASAALSSAKTIEELKDAIAKYPSSSMSESAMLNLATLYFNGAKYQEALDTYQRIADTAEPGDVRNRAKLNIAYTLEAMNKKEEAAERFEQTGRDSSSPSYIRNEANYSAGR